MGRFNFGSRLPQYLEKISTGEDRMEALADYFMTAMFTGAKVLDLYTSCSDIFVRV